MRASAMKQKCRHADSSRGRVPQWNAGRHPRRAEPRFRSLTIGCGSGSRRLAHQLAPRSSRAAFSASLLEGGECRSRRRTWPCSRRSSFALVSVVGTPTPAQSGEHERRRGPRPRTLRATAIPRPAGSNRLGGSSLPCTRWSRCAPSNDGPIFVKCRNREAASHRFGTKSAPMSVGVSSS